MVFLIKKMCGIREVIVFLFAIAVKMCELVKTIGCTSYILISMSSLSICCQ